MTQVPTQIQGLADMRRLANGLLILMVTIYAVSAYFKSSYH